MRNKILFAIITLQTVAANIMAQGLTQSADGSSTIPINGTVVSVDLVKTDLSFGYTNLNQKINSKSLQLLWGAHVKVKNEEGVGALFSKGDIVGSSEANVFIGLNYERPNALVEYLNQLHLKHSRESKRLQDDIKSTLVIMITAINDNTVKTELLTQLAKEANPQNFGNTFQEPRNADSTARALYAEFKIDAQKEGDAYIRLRTRQIQEKKEVSKKNRTTTFERFSFFGFGGASAIDFKQFKGVDSSNLSNSLEDKNERSTNIGLGLNYQRGWFWLGLTYAYLETNNYALLKKAEYTLRTTTTINNQVLIEEKKITGYKGNFGRVSMNSVDVDLIFRLNLDKEKETKNYLLINPYLRSTIATRDKDILPNSANIGTGFYFWSKKFLGGFYVELPDVENNFEKMKPVENQQLRAPLKKMTFGIVTKYNFSTLRIW